jgi:hypothetical protein
VAKTPEAQAVGEANMWSLAVRSMRSSPGLAMLGFQFDANPVGIRSGTATSDGSAVPPGSRKEHNRSVPLLRCQVVRWLSADPSPGWVEARLVDANGRAWLFRDKPSVFCDELPASDRLPVDGAIACEVIAVNRDDDTAVIVDTNLPWGIEATDGTTTFSVSAEQLVADDGPSRDHDTSTPPCPTCSGTGVDAGALRKKRNSPRIARAHFDDPPCPDCLGSGELDDANTRSRPDHREDR